MFALWMLVGWCGTPPKPWPWPPDPDPDPWLRKILGLAGGVAGGWAFGQYIDENIIIGAIGAWVGSVILNEARTLVGGGLRR